MAADLRKMRKTDRQRKRDERKDRLIQTRVDARLQKVLVEQARRRRMSVSNLVRGVLEDAFGLADPDVGPVLEGPLAPPEPEPDLGHIYAWNDVVLGRGAACSRCATAIAAGDHALMGLSEDPTAPRAWLCPDCAQTL